MKHGLQQLLRYPGSSLSQAAEGLLMMDRRWRHQGAPVPRTNQGASLPKHTGWRPDLSATWPARCLRKMWLYFTLFAQLLFFKGFSSGLYAVFGHSLSSCGRITALEATSIHQRSQLKLERLFWRKLVKKLPKKGTLNPKRTPGCSIWPQS